MKVHRIEIEQIVTFKPSRLIKPPKTVQWYWHAIARNGRKLGWTGETYTKRAHCISALDAIAAPFMRGIPVYEVSADGKTKKRIDEHGKPFFS